jgi:hypothetical protein
MTNEQMTNALRLWCRGLVSAVALALLCACASADKPKPVVVQSVVQAPGKATVTVSELNDGASVVLEAAQELRVDLPSSAWAVANNLEWSVVDLNPGVLNVLGSRFERGLRDNNPAEAGGTTVWRLKPQAAGRVNLKFALRRPHSLNPATQTVGFDVTVR